MPVDRYLKIETVNGESEKTGMTGWIDVDSYSWSVRQLSSIASGGAGSGAGRVEFQDLKIVKTVDRTSAVLLQACAAGTHFTKAYLVLKKSGGGSDGGKPYMQFQLGPVFITAIENAGESQDDQLKESVTLSFGALAMQYRPQTSTGTLGPSRIASWSQLRNISSVSEQGIGSGWIS